MERPEVPQVVAASLFHGLLVVDFPTKLALGPLGSLTDFVALRISLPGVRVLTAYVFSLIPNFINPFLTRHRYPPDFMAAPRHTGAPDKVTESHSKSAQRP